MLINELIGVKKFYKRSYGDILRMLQKFGVNFVAGGRYGKIFTSPKWDYVVKIFDNDPYYLSFVNYAIAHPSKHYPQFSRKPLRMHAFHKRGNSEASKYWVVKIEKLQPIANTTKAKFIVDNLENAVDAWYSIHERGNNDLYTMMLGPDEHYHKMLWTDIFKMYPWLETLAEAWYTIFEHCPEGSPDIHAGNFMQRQDGTVVIIDPLWEGSNPYREYQSWLDTETDAYGYGDDEGPEVRGPAYLHKKREQAAIEATRSFAKQLADDDIPF